MTINTLFKSPILIQLTRIAMSSVLLCIASFNTVHAQKGAFSVAAGPFVSVPFSFNRSVGTSLKTGAGLVVVGQYNVSEKSALLLQAGIAGYNNRFEMSYYGQRRISIFSLQGGYKYQFGSAGYFVNGTAGIDKYSDYGSFIAFAAGGGKRFLVKEKYFIDAGLDYMFGDTDSRFNIKAVFSLLRRPRVK